MNNPNTLARARGALAAALLLFASHAYARAQSPPPPQPTDPKQAATLSGRVTVEGRPASDVAVVLTASEWTFGTKPVGRATTDEAGRFKLSNVPPGKYHLSTVSPGYVYAEAAATEWMAGKLIDVGAGDDLKDLNFTLVRGGVVTGRVTDPDGRAVIEAFVSLVAADAEARKAAKPRPVVVTTDDRGVYRAWGVGPGRYVVYAGRAREDNVRRGMADDGGFYPQTFYPSTTDETQAKPIEVAPGSLAEDVDITLGKMVRTYSVSGRVVGEDGRPVVGAAMNVGALASGRFSGHMFGGMKTDERGEFRVRGLTPGDWGVWATTGEMFSETPGTTFSDPVVIAVSDSDVTDIEIKMRKGAAVSGRLVVEGTSDPAVIAKFKGFRFGAWVNTGAQGSPVPNYLPFRPAADGSFQLTGLRSGKLMFDLEWPRPKGFSLLYVRRDGVDLPDGLEVRAGEHVRNVVVAYAYGSSTVRGQVEFRGGKRPDGVTYAVHASRPGGLIAGEHAIVDSLGRFTIENLSAGEYELSLSDWSPNATNRSPLAKVAVSVPEGGEAKATLVYDVTPKKENER